MKLAQALENASAQQDSNRSLLRLTYVLQQRACYLVTSQLGANSPVLDLHSQSAIALLMSHPVLLENLRKAHQGNYGVILSLLGCLDHGLQAKKVVDRVIDTCTFLDAVLLRSQRRDRWRLTDWSWLMQAIM